MIQATLSPKESRARIGTSTSPSINRSFSRVPTTTTDGAIVFALEEHAVYAPLPQGYKEVDDVVARFEADSKKAAALSRARQRLQEAQQLKENAPLTLADLRLRAGMSQKQLASLIGTSQPRLSRIESGLDDILLSTFEKLVAALNVTRDELVAAIRQSVRK